MFTGIIKGVAKVFQIKEKVNLKIFSIKFPDFLLRNLSIGASVSNNGCYLTVTEINNNIISFDVMKEILKITNLSKLKISNKVNI